MHQLDVSVEGSTGQGALSEVAQVQRLVVLGG